MNVMNSYKIWEVYGLEQLKKIDKKKMLTAIGIGIGLLFLAMLIYCYYLTNHVLSANNTIKSLRTELETVTEERDLLASENEELQEKVSILSDTVNSKVKQEEEREAEIAKAHIPTGFPIKGAVTYNEENTTLDGEPVAEFQAAEGTSIIATAEGTVASIAGDSTAGYIIMVDHGNGYFSVYRNGSKPKVEVGTEVTTATELFVIQRGHEKLSYQIIENNTYIDPMSLIEING